jgi:hypothetical protein
VAKKKGMGGLGNLVENADQQRRIRSGDASLVPRCASPPLEMTPCRFSENPGNLSTFAASNAVMGGCHIGH